MLQVLVRGRGSVRARVRVRVKIRVRVRVRVSVRVRGTLHMRIWRISRYLYRYMPVSCPTCAKMYCSPGQG